MGNGGSEKTNGGTQTFAFKSDGTLTVGDDYDDNSGTWRQDGNSIYYRDHVQMDGENHLTVEDRKALQSRP